jgi:hypothetical protein
MTKKEPDEESAKILTTEQGERDEIRRSLWFGAGDFGVGDGV